MATVTVTIRKTSASVCKAVPGAATVGANDTIVWDNTTGDRVILYFPHDKVLGKPIKKNNFKHTIPDGDTYEVDVPSTANRVTGSFRYAVFCRETGTFAVGGSDPEIIVT